MYLRCVVLLVIGNCLVQSERCYETVKHKALFANEKTIQHTTLLECMNYCDWEDSFSCISLDYTSSSTCYLSSQSHMTDPDMYGEHDSSTYAYVTGSGPCDDGSEESEWSSESEEDEGKRCYVFEENMALYTYNDKTIRDVTMGECMAYCDEEESFACISLDFTTLGTCHLSSQSHVTDSDMYGRHDGSSYAYVTSCGQIQDSEENEISETGSEEGEQTSESESSEEYHSGGGSGWGWHDDDDDYGYYNEKVLRRNLGYNKDVTVRSHDQHKKMVSPRRLENNYKDAKLREIVSKMRRHFNRMD